MFSVRLADVSEEEFSYGFSARPMEAGGPVCRPPGAPAANRVGQWKFQSTYLERAVCLVGFVAPVGSVNRAFQLRRASQ